MDSRKERFVWESLELDRVWGSWGRFELVGEVGFVRRVPGGEEVVGVENGVSGGFWELGVDVGRPGWVSVSGEAEDAQGVVSSGGRGRVAEEVFERLVVRFKAPGWVEGNGWRLERCVRGDRVMVKGRLGLRGGKLELWGEDFIWLGAGLPFHRFRQGRVPRRAVGGGVDGGVVEERLAALKGAGDDWGF